MGFPSNGTKLCSHSTGTKLNLFTPGRTGRWTRRPGIDRFVNLVADRNIVFKFTMSEKADGKIRNHGYPWRLVLAEFLDQLFNFQIKLG